MLKEGDVAPAFSLPDADGTIFNASDYKGKYLVVYFYPKDDTTGCTKQAQTFSEMSGEFEKVDAKVIGISPDTVKSHGKFRDKHSLSVTLLADPEKSAIEAYGVWAEKKMYGKAYMGVERSTFLIGPDGKILHVWRNVKVPGHIEDVLETIQRLK